MRAPLPSSGALVGTELGRYRLEALLGDGGMGEVYLAIDLESGEPVAVKVLAVERSRDPSVRTRFEREWRLMRDIEHPNVVSLIDWPEAESGPPHFVMELLEGETLHERLEREQVIEPLEALDTFAQIADGLQAVHESGIVHRDVKPENVYLCDEPVGLVKILDFGLAHVEASPITGTGTLVGTPSFIAPEQATGDALDARTDIYALGLVMYRAMTGHHPFTTDDKVTMLGHQLFSVAPPFAWMVESVPPSLERLVLHMLRKRPSDRPRSMADIAATLRALRSGLDPVIDSPPAVTEDHYGPLNPLARALVKNALWQKGFRIATDPD